MSARFYTGLGFRLYGFDKSFMVCGFWGSRFRVKGMVSTGV